MADEQMDVEARPSTAQDEKSLNLGSKIELSGFREVDRSSMIIVKKIVGNYLKRYEELSQTIESLKINLKIVHETEKSKKYELHGKVINNGKVETAEHTDRNLFFTIDKILASLENILSKE